MIVIRPGDPKKVESLRNPINPQRMSCAFCDAIFEIDTYDARDCYVDNTHKTPVGYTTCPCCGTTMWFKPED
jgi:hypothetical protein